MFRLTPLALGLGLALQTACAQAETTLTDGALRVEPYTFTARNGTEVAAERGTISVPERRSDPNSRMIDIAYVRFASTSDNPGDPIIYLAGGPGGSGSGTARGSRFPLFMALREVADVIAFDQRGTGFSDIPPDCEDPNSPSISTPITRDSMTDYYMAETARCWNVWESQGIDIGAYNTWESAADIESVRVALEADQLNLWGISYGSHLGFAYLKRYGNNVSRAVFAGSEGLDQTVKYPSSTDELFERIEVLIAADSTASQYYPDLTEMMERVHARMEANPVEVTITPRGSDEPVTMTLGAFPVQMIAGFLIKNPESIAQLPIFYLALDNGQYERVAHIIHSQLFSGPARQRAMPLAMDLASGISQDRLGRVEREAQTSLLRDALNFPMPHIAGVVPEADLGEDYREPLQSDVSMLLISGDLDGRTYLGAHANIMETLPNATQLIVRNGGHDIYETDISVQNVVVRYFLGEDVPGEDLELEMPAFLVP